MSITYFADTVGSFIRPANVLQARSDKEAGKIQASDLTKVEDAAIKELVEKQIAGGLKVVVDGEFRREYYCLDFWIGFNEVKIAYDFPCPDNPALIDDHMRDIISRSRTPYAYDSLKFNPQHPELKAYEFLKSVTPSNIIPKVIIPSPTFLYIHRPKGDLFPPSYKSADEFYAGIGKALLDTILAFYKLGARVIQIDEPTWFIFPMIVCETDPQRVAKLKEYANITIKIMKPLLPFIPADLKLGYHLCRGNGDAHHAVPYSYVDCLPFLAELNPAFLLLEYEDERSGPLSDLKGYGEKLAPIGTQIFLGIVSTKTTVVESVDSMEARVREAAKYYPLEKLGVCTQCGFSTLAGGSNKINETAQWGKVQLLAQLEKKIWG